MKKISILLFCTIYVACLGAPTEDFADNSDTLVQDDAGTGNDVGDGVLSPFPVSYGRFSGVLTFDDAGDAYGYERNPGDIVEVQVLPDSKLDVYVTIVQQEFRNIEHDDYGTGFSESIVFIQDATGPDKRFTLFVGRSAGEGQYTVLAKTTAQNDGDQGVDAPENSSQPLAIEMGVFSDNYLGGADNFDDFAIYLNTGETLSVDVVPEAKLDVGYVRGTFCPNCNLARNANLKNDAFVGQVESFSMNAESSGIYSFSVAKIEGTSGRYKLEVAVE